MTRASRTVDLGRVGLDGGGHVLVALALAQIEPGEDVVVGGSHPDLRPQLRAWCSANGHHVDFTPAAAGVAVIRRGVTANARWVGAERAGSPPGHEVVDKAPPTWGLAARGVWIEARGPSPSFRLDTKDEIWTDDAARLYDRALAGQWDPATVVPWEAAPHPDPWIEQAVIQVMTYLVENEEAALVVPARFLGHIHPHFAEVQHFLAAQVSDEARHAHVFARRAALGERPPALSGAAGRMSLQTLLDEPDFATASFLLSVLGEGTFLSLLGFLERHAPDECTRAIARLVRSDEARHVAFGVAHLERHCSIDPTLRTRLAAAIEHRHEQLRSTAGLNQDVFDSLVLLAAGGSTPDEIAEGWEAVQALQRDMHQGRTARLGRLGFSTADAESLAALHTRNFM